MREIHARRTGPQTVTLRPTNLASWKRRISAEHMRILQIEVVAGAVQVGSA